MVEIFIVYLIKVVFILLFEEVVHKTKKNLYTFISSIQIWQSKTYYFRPFGDGIGYIVHQQTLNFHNDGFYICKMSTLLPMSMREHLQRGRQMLGSVQKIEWLRGLAKVIVWFLVSELDDRV